MTWEGPGPLPLKVTLIQEYHSHPLSLPPSSWAGCEKWGGGCGEVGCLPNKRPHPSKLGCVTGSLSLSHRHNPQPTRKGPGTTWPIHHCPSLAAGCGGPGTVSPGHHTSSFLLLQAARGFTSQTRSSTPPPVWWGWRRQFLALTHKQV